jgi:hypothetical protein
MGAVASFKLDREIATPAQRRVLVPTCREDIASRVQVVGFQTSTERVHRITYTVRLKPRTFTEIADHFSRVTQRLEWPVDEADIE